MRIEKHRGGVPPVTPVRPIKPTDNGYRPLHPLPEKAKDEGGAEPDAPVAFKGKVSTQAGGATTRDRGTDEQRSLAGRLYGPDGKLI